MNWAYSAVSLWERKQFCFQLISIKKYEWVFFANFSSEIIIFAQNSRYSDKLKVLFVGYRPYRSMVPPYNPSLSRIWNLAWWKYDMERFAVAPCIVMTISKWFGVVLKRSVGFNSMFRSVFSDRFLERAEDDQSILIKMSSWNQRFFLEPPQPIRNSHYMVLPQTFLNKTSLENRVPQGF